MDQLINHLEAFRRQMTGEQADLEQIAMAALERDLMSRLAEHLVRRLFHADKNLKSVMSQLIAPEPQPVPDYYQDTHGQGGMPRVVNALYGRGRTA